MEKTTAIIKELKPGSFVLIDNAPCRVEKVAISAPGKHGAAKARVDAIGLLDGRRRSLVKPADESIDVPIITKKTAQILAIVGKNAQLMDLTTYEVFELPIPEEIKEKVEAGKEIFYFEIGEIRTIKQIK